LLDEERTSDDGIVRPVGRQAVGVAERAIYVVRMYRMDTSTAFSASMPVVREALRLLVFFMLLVANPPIASNTRAIASRNTIARINEAPSSERRPYRPLGLIPAPILS
jgi:hypothetical protein